MNAKTGGLWRPNFVGVSLLLFLVASLTRITAQDPNAPNDLQALRHGTLVVWVVVSAPPKVTIPSNYAITPPTTMDYREQTAGSFGQSASSFGQNAGSVGIATDSPSIATQKSVGSDDAPPSAADGSGYREQTAGSFGQTAGSFGKAASDHGQTAGSFGGAASNSGTNAGNYGQTAGSFGHSLSTIAQPSAANQQSNQAQPLFASLLKVNFPALQVRYVDVVSDELRDRLQAADGSAESPDVLIGVLPVNWGVETRKQFVLAMVLPAIQIDDGLPPSDGAYAKFLPEAAIFLRAPHPREAKEFALWLNELESGCPGCLSGKMSSRELAAAGVATNAVARLIRGEGLGDLADPEIASLPVQLTRLMLATTQNAQVDGGAARVETIQSSLNGRLAIVSVRVVVSQDRIFGVLHPLVILRKNDAGVWKVLHVSLNLPIVDQRRITQSMMETSPTATAEKAAGVMGVKLAAPPEGDIRPPMPELGWDNGGGAGLQIVEWQRVAAQGWSDARLFLVPDRNPTLQTQATAKFADRDGRYRWRVWSVGNAGETKISPWRTIIVQR